MYCEIEGLVLSPISVEPGSFFKTRLFTGEYEMLSARGWDEYQLAGYIIQNNRVFGLGRTSIISPKQDYSKLRSFNARPSSVICFQKELLMPVILRVENNVLYTPERFQQQLGLKIVDKNKLIFFGHSLSHPYFTVKWVSKGTFDINISPIINKIIRSESRSVH
ncbi:hypothetical protein [Natranaerobius thermophilus]|uniref:Uncharacterized protein n=1 Tax=Natranaerobius thermophilus (strain ATCC BAA-1301 / DSM 18059 / JW/NM-WN-LF) TaxID=457570 RepID=B2A6H3_NATTJ|nr:hypothetical protein [Natranaerobius thermophilus]ACB85506.1 hypothetical protein Nther_1935 [Natranaerobius thermophilus JW/NM-WN-LF]